MGEDMTPAELARACKVTQASVSFWLDGSTKSLKAEKAALIEQKTGYRASWIVTGKGPKKVEDPPMPAEVPAEEAELLDLRAQLSPTSRFALTQFAKAMLATETPIDEPPDAPPPAPSTGTVHKRKPRSHNRGKKAG